MHIGKYFLNVFRNILAASHENYLKEGYVVFDILMQLNFVTWKKYFVQLSIEHFEPVDVVYFILIRCNQV